MLSVPKSLFGRRELKTKPTPWQGIESLESRTLLAADTLAVFIGGAAAKAVQFVDPNGTKAVIRMAGEGNATVTFSGSNLAQGPSPSGIAVSGSGVTVASIAMSRTGLTTLLQVITVGRNQVSVGGITSDSVVAAIRAPGVLVTGDITTGGWVREMVLGGAEDGTISIGPTHINGSLKFTAGSMTDESLVSDIRIGSLSASQWLNTTGAAESLTAPQALAIRVRGSFQPDLNITGIPGAQVSLQTFSAGALSDGTWNVSGKLHTLNTGSISTGWTGTVNGVIDNLDVSHDAVMDLTANEVGKMVVHGALAASTVTLTQPLTGGGFDINNLFVGGTMTDSTIRSAGNVNVVSIGSMQDSNLYVGLVNPTLPAVTSDFANTAEIHSITLRRSASASFSGSNIAAYQLGSVVLGAVATANGGTPFGVGAHSINSITLVDQATHRSAHETNVPNADAFDQLLVSRGIAQGDLVVEIV
jgi:hypothetical protein